MRKKFKEAKKMFGVMSAETEEKCYHEEREYRCYTRKLLFCTETKRRCQKNVLKVGESFIVYS